MQRNDTVSTATGVVMSLWGKEGSKKLLDFHLKHPLPLLPAVGNLAFIRLFLPQGDG